MGASPKQKNSSAKVAQFFYLRRTENNHCPDSFVGQNGHFNPKPGRKSGYFGKLLKHIRQTGLFRSISPIFAGNYFCHSK
jgi:hypothetical protein